MAKPTFYWHDYETWGADPMRDRPAQFAGVRTDWDLNPIGEPLMIYAKPPEDVLPHPEATLVTGITPQKAWVEGVPEPEFIRRIHMELAQPGTCGVGYNSIRFDDEVTRFTLYRNFYDAYAREWQNGNSRWDIIDMVRLTYAVRPEGIEWPQHEDGSPSFRLEELTVANGIGHEAAHDALSDVYATIAVAKLIKDKQPRLFDFALNLRRKQAVAEQLNVVAKKPVLHISAMYPAANGCAALVMPLAYHPTNKNGVLVYDLAQDPTELLQLDAQAIRERLYTRREDMPEGMQRIALKTVHLNRSPVVVTPKLLEGGVAERLQIDRELCRKHYAQIMADPNLPAKLNEVFQPREQDAPLDPEQALYGGGFFSDNDRYLMDQVRQSSPQQLTSNSFPFEDPRLADLLFRYRARHCPELLSFEEQQRWQQLKYSRLHDGIGGNSLNLQQYAQRINDLYQLYHNDTRKTALLKQLAQWGEHVAAHC